MTARDARIALQSLLGTAQDGVTGKNDRAAFERLAVAPAASEWPPNDGLIITSPGWSFSVIVKGDDLVIENVRGTCFGGSDDPQDNGDTASGISTKDNPDIVGISLPMDFGDRVPNTKGSPIPRIPWKTMVEVIVGSMRITIPLMDIGPARKTKNAFDLTIAAARQFDPKATARNFEIRGNVRIIGGARFLPA